MTCKVEGCDRAVRKTGMCGAHYAAAWRAKNPDKVKAAAERAKADGRAAAATQRWRERNPDKVKEQERRRYAKDPEGQVERTRKWREANPDKVKAAYERAKAEGRLAAATRRYKERNPDRLRELNRQSYARNPEARRAAHRRWVERNPDAYKAMQAKRDADPIRRAKRNHARWALMHDAVKYVITDRDLRRLYSSPCIYCGKKDAKMTADHVIPLARGGTHGIGNLAPACKRCNSSKRHSLVVEWRSAQARLGAVA